MNSLPATYGAGSGDLIQQANQFVLAILFPSSKSAVFPLALNLAKAASSYQLINLHDHEFHVAFFAADIEAMKRALSLLSFAKRIAHTQVYGRGQLITNPYSAASVIECYMNSLKPSDHRAHCHIVKHFRMDSSVPMLSSPGAAIPEIDHVDIEIKLGEDFHINVDSFDYPGFVVPCGYVAKYADFKLSPDMAVTLEDQMKAAGARSSCDWCPNFKPDEFKKL